MLRLTHWTTHSSVILHKLTYLTSQSSAWEEAIQTLRKYSVNGSTSIQEAKWWQRDFCLFQHEGKLSTWRRMTKLAFIQSEATTREIYFRFRLIPNWWKFRKKKHLVYSWSILGLFLMNLAIKQFSIFFPFSSLLCCLIPFICALRWSREIFRVYFFPHTITQWKKQASQRHSSDKIGKKLKDPNSHMLYLASRKFLSTKICLCDNSMAAAAGSIKRQRDRTLSTNEIKD